jgi:uncharacterized protein YgiM (DUF1202 family)
MQKGDCVKFIEKESEWPGWVWCINNNGIEGWVPSTYLKLQENYALLLQDYDATEITAKMGEEFLIEGEESGWFWVSDEAGNKGWIPIKNVEVFLKKK